MRFAIAKCLFTFMIFRRVLKKKNVLTNKTVYLHDYWSEEYVWLCDALVLRSWDRDRMLFECSVRQLNEQLLVDLYFIFSTNSCSCQINIRWIGATFLYSAQILAVARQIIFAHATPETNAAVQLMNTWDRVAIDDWQCMSHFMLKIDLRSN